MDGREVATYGCGQWKDAMRANGARRAAEPRVDGAAEASDPALVIGGLSWLKYTWIIGRRARSLWNLDSRSYRF